MKGRLDYESIKATIDIVALVAQYTDLEEQNGCLRAICPLHDEDTPSFYIYPKKQRFVCYGCNARGDVFDFVMRIDNCSIRDAFYKISSSGVDPSTTAPKPLTPAQCSWVEESLELADIWQRVFAKQDRKNFHRNRGNERDREPWKVENEAQRMLIEKVIPLTRKFRQNKNRPGRVSKINEARPLLEKEVAPFIFGTDTFRGTCIALLRDN